MQQVNFWDFNCPPLAFERTFSASTTSLRPVAFLRIESLLHGGGRMTPRTEALRWPRWLPHSVRRSCSIFPALVSATGSGTYSFAEGGNALGRSRALALMCIALGPRLLRHSFSVLLKRDADGRVGIGGPSIAFLPGVLTCASATGGTASRIKASATIGCSPSGRLPAAPRRQAPPSNLRGSDGMVPHAAAAVHGAQLVRLLRQHVGAAPNSQVWEVQPAGRVKPDRLRRFLPPQSPPLLGRCILVASSIAASTM